MRIPYGYQLGSDCFITKMQKYFCRKNTRQGDKNMLIY